LRLVLFALFFVASSISLADDAVAKPKCTINYVENIQTHIRYCTPSSEEQENQQSLPSGSQDPQEKSNYSQNVDGIEPSPEGTIFDGSLE